MLPPDPRDRGGCSGRNVPEIGRGEVELCSTPPVSRGRPERTDSRKWRSSDRVVGGELHAANEAIAIVERRENDRRAELAFVDQVPGLLVVSCRRRGSARCSAASAPAPRSIIIGSLGERGSVRGDRPGARGVPRELLSSSPAISSNGGGRNSASSRRARSSKGPSCQTKLMRG